jgi:hypothetical protein
MPLLSVARNNDVNFEDYSRTLSAVDFDNLLCIDYFTRDSQKASIEVQYLCTIRCQEFGPKGAIKRYHISNHKLE